MTSLTEGDEDYSVVSEQLAALWASNSRLLPDLRKLVPFFSF